MNLLDNPMEAIGGLLLNKFIKRYMFLFKFIYLMLPNKIGASDWGVYLLKI